MREAWKTRHDKKGLADSRKERNMQPKSHSKNPPPVGRSFHLLTRGILALCLSVVHITFQRLHFPHHHLIFPYLSFFNVFSSPASGEVHFQWRTLSDTFRQKVCLASLVLQWGSVSHQRAWQAACSCWTLQILLWVLSLLPLRPSLVILPHFSIDSCKWDECILSWPWWTAGWVKAQILCQIGFSIVHRRPQTCIGNLGSCKQWVARRGW